MTRVGDSNNSQTATIEEAYGDLTQEAFAVWMRLMVASDAELRAGRNKVAKILGYSEGRSNAILRELKHKGYVSLSKSGYGPGAPTYVTIERRAKIAGRTRFVQLSSVLAVELGELSEDTPNPTTCQFQLHTNSTPKMGKMAKVRCDGVSEFAHSFTTHNLGRILWVGPFFHDFLRDVRAQLVKKGANLLGGASTQSNPTNSSQKNPSSAATKSAHGMLAKKKGAGATKDVLESGSDSSRSETSGDGVKGSRYRGLDLSRFSKEGKKGITSLFPTRSVGKRRAIDWSKLDLNGKPAITWSPKPAERASMLEALDRRGQDPTRIALREKMASEVLRVYTAYRKEARFARNIKRYIETKDNENDTLYKRERVLAAQFGEHCIRFSVTPKQVIKYWHDNISNFTDMKFPPLRFLAMASNVDRVSCVDHDDPKPKRKTPEKAEVIHHSFSDTSKLDKRLRPGLEAAGYDTRSYNDRYLLTVQATARALAKGWKPYMAPKLKAMSSWAAENLYADLEIEVGS